MDSKVLLVFCDGTSNDGNIAAGASPSNTNLTTSAINIASSKSLNLQDTLGGGVQYPTNVLRLSRAVQSRTSDGRRQIVFYQSGVGSEADFDGNTLIEGSVMQLFGVAVASKIRDAYAFIAQNFEDGDDICIFGFSRGAYTARKLSGLIDKIGLLEREQLGAFFQIWKDLADGKTPDTPEGTRQTKIKCVGVWDTVGSVFSQSIFPQPIVDALSIKDTSLPDSVEIALHALSLHENREKFLPTLWTSPNPENTKVFKQIWFPGAHADVGGSFERHELADISLFWMAGEVSSFINLDLDFLQQSHQQDPDLWGTSQPHNSFQESDVAVQAVVGHKTRLEGKCITMDDQFHQSVLVSPTNLDKPLFMVTLDTLRDTFGKDWEPKCPPLNEFEVKCKEQWGRKPTLGGKKGDSNVKFENPFDLFGFL